MATTTFFEGLSETGLARRFLRSCDLVASWLHVWAPPAKAPSTLRMTPLRLSGYGRPAPFPPEGRGRRDPQPTLNSDPFSGRGRLSPPGRRASVRLSCAGACQGGAVRWRAQARRVSGAK